MSVVIPIPPFTHCHIYCPDIVVVRHCNLPVDHDGVCDIVGEKEVGTSRRRIIIQRIRRPVPNWQVTVIGVQHHVWEESSNWLGDTEFMFSFTCSRDM